jgi:GNAT superfamily N-acetyltransferase
MNFEYRTESVRTDALELDYYLVPWDTEILNMPIAQIERLQIKDAAQAAHDYRAFAHWCAQQRIAMCACRLPADQLSESMFLEERGFRFVELNFPLRLTGLQARSFPEDSAIRILQAEESDREELGEMAAQILGSGRFIQDPHIDPELGRRRYRIWTENAFTHPRQQVVKCLVDDAIVAFFVIERRAADHCFWSLGGMAPGQQGKGLGKRVWNAMLSRHRAEGVDTMSTSISSHNTAVFNLYVSLGFRILQASTTLHCWYAHS